MKRSSRFWRRAKRSIRSTPAYLILFLYTLFCLFPIVWIILTSLKSHADINSYPPQFLFNVTFENYESLIASHDFVQFLINSIVAASGSTFFVMLLGVPAAYALARYQVGGTRLSDWILSMRMFPPIAMVVPIFLMFRVTHLLHSMWALFIVYTVMNLAFAIWLMIGFFADVPREIDEAAMVDGCTIWGALWRVNIPAVAPGLASAAILSMIFAWNEFLFAVILGGGTAKTLPVGVAGFITDRAIYWGPMSAAAVIAMIPILVFAMFVQRYLVRGLTLGAVD